MNFRVISVAATAASLAFACGGTVDDSSESGQDIVIPSETDGASNQGGGGTNSGPAQTTYTVFPGPCSEKNRYLEDYENDEPNWLHEVYYKYDERDRLFERSRLINGQDREIRYYFYDEALPERLIQMQWRNLFEEDESGVVQYIYDEEGRLELEGEDVDGDLVSDITTQYVYGDDIIEIYVDNDKDQQPDLYTLQQLDSAGNITVEDIYRLSESSEDPEWHIEYVYDSAGRLEEEWRHFQYLATPIYILYVYDENGNKMYSSRTQDETNGVQQYMTEFDYSCWPK